MSKLLPHAENGPMRETAIGSLKSRAKELIRRGNGLLALANTLEAIQKSATEGCEGDGRHPYIGVGSQAEEALWDLVCSYRA